MSWKSTIRKLPDFLDALVAHGVTTTASKIVGVSRVTIWRITNASEAGDPDLQEIEWAGLMQPFHLHLLSALDMSIQNVQEDVTHAAWKGRMIEPVVGGIYQFEDCEHAMSLSPKEFEAQLAMDEEMRDMLGYPKVWYDRKKRVLDPVTGIWERVRTKQFLPPTLEAAAKVLSAFAPDVFGDKRKIDVTMNGSLGVSVGAPFGSKPPIEVGYVQPLPVEYTGTDLVPDEIAELVEQFVVADEIDEDEAAAADDEQEAPVAPDDEFDPAQRDLLARLRASATPLEVQKAEKAEEALKRRIAARDPDLDPRFTGRGTTTGFKVA
jgi:hypothetical protein